MLLLSMGPWDGRGARARDLPCLRLLTTAKFFSCFCGFAMFAGL
jgi:hypothetical protein